MTPHPDAPPSHTTRRVRLFLVVAAAASLLLACGSWTTLEEYPCPKEGTTLTYDNFGKQFFASYCNSCHSVDSTARRGAPVAYHFDTYDAIKVLKNRIFLRSAANNTTMPPGPDDPPKDQRDKLAEWIACGVPK